MIVIPRYKIIDCQALSHYTLWDIAEKARQVYQAIDGWERRWWSLPTYLKSK